MIRPLSDVEQRLTYTLREVAAQTEATPGGVERLQTAVTGHAPASTRYRPTNWRLATVAAVLALVTGGSVWAVRYVDETNQISSAEATTAEMVRVPDLAPGTSPLYLLPPEGTDLSKGVQFSDEPPVDAGSGLVVGRVTDNGFDEVVLVSHLTSGPTFGKEGSTIEIAGRELYQPSYGDGAEGNWTAAEELVDGTWIEYATGAGGNRLAEAVAGTKIVDGNLTWTVQPGGLEELGHMADLQSSQITWVSSPSSGEPASSGFLIQTSTYNPDLGFASVGLYGPAERTTVNGRPAFLIRPHSGSRFPRLVLTWATTSGHVVFLSSQKSEDELRAFAAELRAVDRQTWEAELSPFDADHGD